MADAASLSTFISMWLGNSQVTENQQTKPETRLVGLSESVAPKVTLPNAAFTADMGPNSFALMVGNIVNCQVVSL